eukprot:352866-Chlamydomonas_euryale.AAC.1
MPDKPRPGLPSTRNFAFTLTHALEGLKAVRCMWRQGCTGRAYEGSSTSGTYRYVAQTYGTSQTFR